MPTHTLGDTVAEPLMTRTDAAYSISVLEDAIDGVLRTDAKRRHLAVAVGYIDDGNFIELANKEFRGDTPWETDYMFIARQKAALSAKHRMSTREIQLMHHELLEHGDIKYWGSVVVGNIVVGVSGVESYFDEAFAYMVAYLFRGLIQHSQERKGGLREQGSIAFE
jgi:hypothetical protein